jgi:sarcosine oxidase
MDVIVVGLGGMGSAAVAQLAVRGHRVIGVDQFTAAHSRGSSHGRSRIIRQAYLEGSHYVPLLLRAYELWRELERETGTRLLTLTGGLMIGRPDSQTVAGSIASAVEHDLHHDILSAAEIRAFFPQLQVGPDMVALREPMAGFLDPERSILAHLQRATNLGAELHFEEPVLSWSASTSASGSGVRVTTTRGTYDADRLILATGPWAPQLLSGLGLPFTIERQVLYWFDPVGGTAPFDPDRFPIFIWELDDGLQFYGFPAQDGPPGGVKVAFYHQGQSCTPETIDRAVHPAEIDRMRAVLAEYAPSLNGPLLATATCMYTNTPDHHFLLGLHPEHANVVLASPCSGHGYKFASVIGEVLAELAIDGTTRHPIESFAVTRFD